MSAVDVIVETPELSNYQMVAHSMVRHYLRTRTGKSTFLTCDGRQKGKTFKYVSALAPSFFTLKNTRFGFGAMTYQRSEAGWTEIRTYCQSIVDMSGIKGVKFAPLKEGIIEWRNGQSWHRLSMGQQDAGQGFSFNAIMFDEAHQMPKATWETIQPTLSTTRGLSILTCTSPRTMQEWRNSLWWIEIIKMSEAERNRHYPDWHVENNPTTASDLAFIMRAKDKMNGHSLLKNEEYLEHGELQLKKMLRAMGTTAYEREVLVKLVEPNTMSVFDRMTDEHIKEVDIPDGCDLIVGIDKGEGRAWTVVLYAYTWVENEHNKDIGTREVRKWHVFKEVVYKRYIRPDILINNHSSLFGDRYTIFFPDPRAKSVHQVLDEYGLEYKSGSVPIEDGVQDINYAFEFNQITISPECKVLISQLKEYRENDDGNYVDTNNDAVDALRYMIYNSRKHYGGFISDESLFGGNNDDVFTSIGSGLIEVSL